MNLLLQNVTSFDPSIILGSERPNRVRKKQESFIKPMFVDPSSLPDRAERAKTHIKRVYGPNSIEYKSLTGKKY